MNYTRPENNGPRRVSCHCFGGLPKPRNQPLYVPQPEKYGPFVPRAKPARFDDAAGDFAASSIVTSFLELNAPRTDGGWELVDARVQIALIKSRLLAARTHQGTSFATDMRNADRELFVGLVHVPERETCSVVVRGGLGFEPHDEAFEARRLGILTSTDDDTETPALYLPEARWVIARRKFGLPGSKGSAGSRYVAGPYLGVGVYEPQSGAFARLRLWPVWRSIDGKYFAIVRSELERAAVDAAHIAGAVVFTPFRRNQLLELQAGLLHRWVGDASTYPYLPDMLLMPAPGKLVSVLEIFGVKNLQPYVRDQRKKIRAGSENPSIRFGAIAGPLATPRGVRDAIEAYVRDPRNGVWRAG